MVARSKAKFSVPNPQQWISTWRILLLNNLGFFGAAAAEKFAAGNPGLLYCKSEEVIGLMQCLCGCFSASLV